MLEKHAQEEVVKSHCRDWQYLYKNPHFRQKIVFPTVSLPPGNLFREYSLKRLPGGNETVGNTIFCLKCGFLYKCSGSYQKCDLGFSSHLLLMEVIGSKRLVIQHYFLNRFVCQTNFKIGTVSSVLSLTSGVISSLSLLFMDAMSLGWGAACFQEMTATNM